MEQNQENKNICKYCGEKVELNQKEINGEEFICPICNNKSNKLIKKETRHKNIRTIFYISVISWILSFFLSSPHYDKNIYYTELGKLTLRIMQSFGFATGMVAIPLIITFLVLLYRLRGINDKYFAKVFLIIWIIISLILLNNRILQLLNL